MKEKIRVISFINSLANGGAEKQSVFLAIALKDVCDTTLVVYYGNRYDTRLYDFAIRSNIKIIWLRGNHILRILQIYQLFKSGNIQFVFSFLATTNFLNAIVGTLAGVKYRIGGVRNERPEPGKTILQRFLHNNLLKYSIFNNYAGKRTLVQKGFKEQKCVVIPNCIEIDVPAIVRKENTDVVILSVARFVEQKDYPTAIRAICLLCSSMQKINTLNIRYCIVGYGKLEERIRSLIKEYSLDDMVTVIINPPDIEQNFKKADIFLTTSLFEGTSNSIMEAMSYSLPVVATDCGDNNRLVENNTTGFICEVGNEWQISECLMNLVVNYKKRIDFGRKGYNKIKTEYSLAEFKRRYIEFIKIAGGG